MFTPEFGFFFHWQRGCALNGSETKNSYILGLRIYQYRRWAWGVVEGPALTVVQPTIFGLQWLSQLFSTCSGWANYFRLVEPINSGIHLLLFSTCFSPGPPSPPPYMWYQVSYHVTQLHRAYLVCTVHPNKEAHDFHISKRWNTEWVRSRCACVAIPPF